MKLFFSKGLGFFLLTFQPADVSKEICKDLFETKLQQQCLTPPFDCKVLQLAAHADTPDTASTLDAAQHFSGRSARHTTPSQLPDGDAADI